MINIIIKKILRFILHILWIIPLKRKTFLFVSFQGSTIGCSPYYIYQELSKQYPNFKYIWCYNKEKQNTHNVRYVKQKSILYIYYLITSKFIINNSSCPTWIPYRRKQIIINTWHGGGAYKRVATDEFKTKDIISKEKQSAKDTTYFISSCKKFTEVMIPATFVPESKFLNIGMPRNDIFFNQELVQSTNFEVRNQLNISNDDFVVLYAPTYRGSSLGADNFSSILDLNILRESLKNKFHKNIKILFRGHYFFSTDNSINQFDINVSDYPVMQELLCASDMLITDYSSCMWDFSLTKKICILFAPDIETYIQNRGFYTEPVNWGFPIAKSNEELKDLISIFDFDKYITNINKSLNFMGSFEDGCATSKIIELIKNKLQEYK